MSKFKIGDRVRVIATKERLENKNVGVSSNITPPGSVGEVTDIDTNEHLPYHVMFDAWGWWLGEQDLELVEEPTAEFVQEGKRTFTGGATRDTAQGKLDYVKGLSPIVLRRYMQYLDKHRLQPDGSYREFDNWKRGIPQDVYHSSGGRHFLDAWLLTEGYTTEDNHGPVEIEDALCAQLFNVMGRLHEILKDKVGRVEPDRDKPVPGGY